MTLVNRRHTRLLHPRPSQAPVPAGVAAEDQARIAPSARAAAGADVRGLRSNSRDPR